MSLIQFDPAKDAANVKKHGISLVRFADMTDRLVAPDPGHSKLEPRWIVVGKIDQRIYVAVVTDRANQVRVISLRPASRKERLHYGETTTSE